MAEHQDLGVPGGAAAGEKREPGQYSAEHQVDQAWRHSSRSCRIDRRSMHRVPAQPRGAVVEPPQGTQWPRKRCEEAAGGVCRGRLRGVSSHMTERWYRKAIIYCLDVE